jgi:hypothetical protein
MQHTTTKEHREFNYTLWLTDVQSVCSLKGVARFKDIVKGLSDQTARKLGSVAKIRAELDELLGAYQRYRELLARIEPESESAQIGVALLFNVPVKTHQEINPYPLSERGMREIEDAAENGIGIDPRTLDLAQYPLWKIMREILRQVPEMRVYELEAHLKAFGVPKSERSAIESSLKTHRRQFRITVKGREKFVGWKEGSNDEAEEPVHVPSRKIATKAKRQRK